MPSLNSVFLWASFVCMYFSLIMMKIPLLAFGSNCDKVIQRCRCHQVYSDLLLTAMHSSVHASTSASCLLLPVVLGVPAHCGLVHRFPGCHGCLPACCCWCWCLEFQIVTVAWFTRSRPSLLPCSRVSSLSPLSSCLLVPGSCTTSSEPLLSFCLIPSSSSLEFLALVQRW